MALPAMALSAVRSMNAAQRTRYFETHARYFADAPKPYAIRLGSKTLTSNDTMDLRKQFDKLLDGGKR